MGGITESIKVVNHTDEILAAQGIIAPEQTRSVKTEALIDMGATFLSLRKSVIEKLLTRNIRKDWACFTKAA